MSKSLQVGLLWCLGLEELEALTGRRRGDGVLLSRLRSAQGGYDLRGLIEHIIIII